MDNNNSQNNNNSAPAPGNNGSNVIHNFNNLQNNNNNHGNNSSNSSNNSNGNNNGNNNNKKHEPCLFKTVKFALAIVRNPFMESDNFGKWLAVNETSGRGWWIPAGALEKGENFQQACFRECLEEAGIQIAIKGILKVDHSLSGDVCRMRVIYYCEPTTLEQANNFKTLPDSESLGARWVSIDELLGLASTSPGLRGQELLNWAMYLENKGHVFPLEMFGEEGELQPLGSQSVSLQNKPQGNSFVYKNNGNDSYNTRVSTSITPEQRQFMEWANARRKDNLKFESV